MRSEIRKIRDKNGVGVASKVMVAICKHWSLGPDVWHGLGLDDSVKLPSRKKDHP